MASFRRLLIPAMCLAALAPAAALAQAPAAAPESDERCLLEMIALSNASDQNASQMGRTGVLFFAGRLKGRDPNFDFARLKPMIGSMNAQTAQSDLQQRCGPMVSTALQQLQTALGPPPGAATPPAAAAKPSAPAAKPATPPKK